MSKHDSVLSGNIPHPDIVTGLQIDNVLRIIMALTPVLINPAREAENIPGKNAADGESMAAVSVTMMAACARLDEILGDKSRWDTTFQKRLEANADQIQKAQVLFIQTQTLAENEVLTPHFRYRPEIVKTDANTWMASVGQGDSTIMGLGSSPEAAMRAFDEIFKGHVPLFMLNWLLQREAAFDAGQTPPPAPKSNEPKRMVKGRNKTAPKTSRGQKDRRGNLGDNEPPLGGS